MELLKLPEAAEPPKGVSIDDYSTSGTRLRSRYERPNPGCFSCSKRPLIFCSRDKGGGEHKKPWGWNIPAFLELSCFLWLPLLFGFHNDDTEKSGETIATPPKRGVPTGPDSGPLEHTAIRPQGSLSSVFIPAGRLGTAPRGALKEGRRTYEMAAILGVGVVRLLRGIALIVSSSIKTIFSPNSHVNSTASLVVSAFQNSSSVSTESTGSPSIHFLRIMFSFRVFRLGPGPTPLAKEAPHRVLSHGMTSNGPRSNLEGDRWNRSDVEVS